MDKKKTIVQEGERSDGPPPATIATSEGGIHSLGNYVIFHILWGVMNSTNKSGYLQYKQPPFHLRYVNISFCLQNKKRYEFIHTFLN